MFLNVLYATCICSRHCILYDAIISITYPEIIYMDLIRNFASGPNRRNEVVFVSNLNTFMINIVFKVI